MPSLRAKMKHPHVTLSLKIRTHVTVITGEGRPSGPRAAPNPATRSETGHVPAGRAGRPSVTLCTAEVPLTSSTGAVTPPTVAEYEAEEEAQPPRSVPVSVKLTGPFCEGAGAGDAASCGVRYELYMYPHVPPMTAVDEASSGSGTPRPLEAVASSVCSAHTATAGTPLTETATATAEPAGKGST